MTKNSTTFRLFHRVKLFVKWNRKYWPQSIDRIGIQRKVGLLCYFSSQRQRNNDSFRDSSNEI